MHLAPLMGVGEQTLSCHITFGVLLCSGKVALAEWLQRVLGGQGCEQVAATFFTRFTCGSLTPARLQVITQLADQYRGWLLGVVDDAAAHPADVELFAGGEQRFEEQVSVILAA